MFCNELTVWGDEVTAGGRGMNSLQKYEDIYEPFIIYCQCGEGEKLYFIIYSA